MISGRGRGGGGEGARPPRRGVTRSRAFASRAPRDFDDFARKFQEPLSKNDGSKYDGESKLGEDPRISKLLRRLCTESDSEKALSLCAKLRETVVLPENSRYVRRAHDNIVDGLLSVLYEAPDAEIKAGAANVLGRIGYAIGPDFKKHLDWTVSKYESQRNEEIRRMLVVSIRDTLALDAENPSLGEFATAIVKQLQLVIERTDSSKIFCVAVEAITMLAENYPDSFAEHFIDTVDILIGWHMDASQSRTVKDFALKTLEEFGQHWQNESVFSINLLGQFIDDMVAYAENLEKLPERDSRSTDEIPSDPKQCVQSIVSFISVFNTVAKSLGEMFSSNDSKSITLTFLTESFKKILRTVLITLKVEYDKDLINAGNESIFLMLEKLHGNVSSISTILYDVIDHQLVECRKMDDRAILILLDVIRKVVKQISSNLSSQFIKAVLGPSSYILSLRNSKNCAVRETVVAVYQYLLNLKNIPLLQDVYRYVLEDIEKAYKTIFPGVEIFQNSPSNLELYDDFEVEFIILFNLKCLSDIANASNSIIGMWALQPSILELLAVKLVPFNNNLSTHHPAVQYSIIYLLYSHCRKNNHFIASSDLITFGQQRANVCDLLRKSNIKLGETSTTSPTSGHFAIILALFNKLFKCKLPVDTLLLVLNWTADIFNQLVKSYTSAFHSKYLVELILDCINVGFSSNERILELVLKNLDILLINKIVHLNISVMKILGKLCIVHINNNNDFIRKKFCSLFVFVPWNIAIDLIKICHMKVEKYNSTKLTIINCTNIKRAEKEHLMKDSQGQMTAGEFKQFMNYLLFSHNYEGKWLEDLFLNCWPIKDFKNDTSHLDFFRLCALNFSSVLWMWASWQSASLCIALKLRTPLGKPQETFTNIESAIKQLARDLTASSSSNQNKVVESSLSKLKRSRLLIEFFEFLEKSMQNAMDGCAVVLLPMEKPVRTFFHTNSSTCQEWLNRVRPAAIVVSLHIGHASSAIRHAHSLLYTPSINNSLAVTQDLLLYCISLARAYLLRQEPECLIGLYCWVKKVYGKKLPWLKAAADQGAMRYETALSNYINYLQNFRNMSAENEGACNEKTNGSISNHENKFINEQIVECYKNIQFWGDLIIWNNEQAHLLNNESSFELRVDFSEVNCYKKFQEDCIIFSEELSDWNILTFNDESSEILNIFNKTECTLKNIALKILYDSECLENVSDNIENCINFLQASLYELSRNQPCEILTNVHIMHHAATNLFSIIIDRKFHTIPFFTTLEQMTLKNLDPKILNNVMWWCDYFLKLAPQEVDISFIENIRLDLIKSSRKHYNFKLATREVIKYFNFSNHFQTFSENPIVSLDDVYDLSLRTDMNMWTSNNIVAVMEAAKILYANETSRELAMNLCASASLGVSQRLALEEHTYDFRERGTRMLLTLSKWVQNENDKILTNNLNSPLTKLVTALPEIGLVNNNISAHVIPISDSAVGKLLQFSVNQCPVFAKAWFTFGSWCFRWGKRMVEFSSNTGAQLTENDKCQIQSIILQGNSDEFEKVCEILSKTRVICDDEDIDWNEINTSDMIENQLRSISCLRNVYPENLILLVDIWRQAQKRVFSYYELSADAYFKFLHLSSSSDINHNGECAVVTATLRLLRLIVKHAMELQNVLETGLANTPTQPWKVIIPQLFSRLNHPENYVRCRVSELLCRLAEDAPHLITFPAVVGAVENKKNNIADFSKSVLLDSEDNEIEFINNIEDESTFDSNNDYLNSCFMDMVDTLSKQAPTTILQVKLLVKELRRINLLWDELWLRTLAQHHSGISKRLVQLNSEILKVNANNNLQYQEKENLISEKYRIFTKPILFILEQLAEITRGAPETPYEKLFQEKFGEVITETLDKLHNPVFMDKPMEFWQPIKQLQAKLQQKSNKRSLYMLKMSDISPILANMKDTVIAMPGVQASKVRITIMSIDNNVAILPSKTKPKKLKFHGSDGRLYTYLFKGLEDLHLDERIMQFLSITNIMMAQDKEDTVCQTYRAHHYSVIPLGPRSGLISWVENLTPLFTLYKRWQQREAVSISTKNNSSKTPVILRPSELFYNKLIPLLNAAGVSTENRKEWPLVILKQVLIELMSETPNDLLGRELWSSSVTPGQWWHTIRRYSFSVAVMSTIGYIIGLGDRHLDNVLIDLSTGEVVHIDYNVCFEDGKTLRVPEKVPFRMTPNLERCLGATGVEGIFRMACEHVLKTMKRGRKTLLTLLEAFVYDPLVEWSSETGGGATEGTTPLILPGHATAIQTAAIERQCALDLLTVRIHEVRYGWNESRDEMQNHIIVLHESIQSWMNEQEKLQNGEIQLQHYHYQLALVKELEALGKDLTEHPLYSIAQRYSSYKQMKDAIDESTKNLMELHQECKNKIDNFNCALETIKGSQLAQWIQELNFPIDHENHLVFNIVHDFLLNAGQSSMIAQCEQSEAELGQYAHQQLLLIKNCLELLNQFATMSQYVPSTFLEKHRTALYLKWSAMLLEAESVDVCNEVMAQIHNFRSPESANNPPVQQIMAFAYQLQNIINDDSAKLNKILDRLKVDGGADALSRCEKGYIDASAAIVNFISQGNSTEKAMECVIINTLCNLNRRFLTLETSVQNAGDCLIDLPSRDGDWFLDDMYITSSIVNELIILMQAHIDVALLNDDKIMRTFDCLKAVKSIFSELKEVQYNFQTIILPEAIKKIQSEESSVIMMINELNSVVVNTDCSSLNDLIVQLELNLRYIIMENETTNRAHLIASDLKTRYKKLTESVLEFGANSVTSQSHPNPGQMLLMGTDGLFTQLGGRGAAIIDILNALNIPSTWKKVDQVIEACDFSGTLNSKQMIVILDDIFIIKRIQAITDFFNLCIQMSRAFKGDGPIVVFNDEKLCKPIKRFVADYVVRQFLGVQSQCLSICICLLLQKFGFNMNKEIEQKHIGVSWKVPLNELCESYIGSSLKSGVFTPSLVQQANALCANLDTAFRRRESIVILEKCAQLQSLCVSRLRLQLTTHTWLRGEGKGLNGGPTPIAELRRAGNQLSTQKPNITVALDKHRSLVSSAEQRLKWAAGANPALNEIMSAFECAVNIREDRLNVEHTLATSVGTACAALSNLHVSMSGGRDIAALAARRRSALGLLARSSHTPTHLHESLLQLLEPEGNIDINWVKKVSQLVAEKILMVQKDLLDVKSNVSTYEDNLKTTISKLHSLKNAHESLITDTRNVLKIVSKIHENVGLKASDYLAKHKSYLDIITEIIEMFNSPNLSEKSISLNELVSKLESETNTIYEELMNFESTVQGEDTSISKRRGTLTRQLAGIWNSPVKQNLPSKGRTQQANAYAVSVWKRVRLKLEGRDPDPARKYSNQEQVDYIIQEAMSLDNLCLLYEGWTPWV